jgi:MFS family permease
MDKALRARLEKNIGKYSWFKIFTKRVYLPLIAVQLVTVGGVTVRQLAIIAIATSLVQVILQLPTGYVADRYGNRTALIIGSLLAALSPLFYIFSPNFIGGLLAALLFFSGFSFQSGAVEAFMHDTLVALGKEKEYSKVMGRSQSYGLIGNVILLVIVPATYTINKTLPFIIGFISLLIMLWLSISFTYPEHETHTNKKHPLSAAKLIVTPQNISLFIFAGFLAGVSNKAAEYRELLYKDIGVAVALFGLLLALGSIFGAILGRYIHLLDKLKPSTFYFLDLTLMSASIMIVGISKSPIVAVTGFTIFAGYTRVRMITFQSNLLRIISHSYKATLLSALNFFSIIGEIAAITLLARLIGFKGYLVGYMLYGFAVFGIAMVLWTIMLATNHYTMSNRSTQ